MTASSDTLDTQRRRNLENQRNHRQRRQQRLQELEEKVQQYEKARVQATEEVQHAARLVAAENAMLRDLLKRYNGIGDEEIARLKREWVAGYTDSRPPIAHKTVPPTQSARGISAQSSPVMMLSQARSVPQTSAVSTPPHSPACDSSAPSCDERPQTQQHILPRSKLSYDDSPTIVHATVATPTKPQPGISASMSCEKAAEILSSIRTSDDMADIRANLGCTSSGSCTVNNAHLMQVMDEAV